MSLTIYQAITLITPILLFWVALRSNRLQNHPAKLAEKQLSDLIENENVSKISIDLKHSQYDQHQFFTIKNISNVPAHNIKITFSPAINFKIHDKEKFENLFPSKILYPRKKIFLDYQYHIYGKRDYFDVTLEWSSTDGIVQNKSFHLNSLHYT